MNDFLIRAENLEAEYLGGYFGIKDVSLCLDRGQCLVVYGREGSGKSTLLRVLAGLENIKSGNILLDGKELGSILPKDRDIGFSFDYRSLDLRKSVGEILSYPMMLRNYDEDIIKDKTQKLVSSIGLDKDTKAKRLNALKKSLLILYRLFSIERKLYLVDDLTYELTDDEKNEYYANLRSVVFGKSVIIATRDRDLALDLGKENLLILSDGIGTGQGTFEEISALPPNMESASVCGYELHIGILQKDGDRYIGILEETPNAFTNAVNKPINDIYLGKKVCFCIKDGIMQSFYYDLNCERLISKE